MTAHPRKSCRCLPSLLLALLGAGALHAGHGDLEWAPERFRSPFSAEERAGAHVTGRSFDFEDRPHLDGQWLGISAADPRYVYFSVGTHTGRHHADVFRYDREGDRVELLANLKEVVEPVSAEAVPQEKIHTPIMPAGEVFYAGTSDGRDYPDRVYPGGHWLEIDRESGALRDLGASASGDGILAAAYDPERGILYGHTNHRGRLVAFNPGTGEERDLGFPWEGWEGDWPRGIELMIAPNGRVYGGRPPDARFWEYDPETDQLQTLPIDLPRPEEVAAGDPKAVEQSGNLGIHRGIWNEPDGCFYFVRSFDEMLGRLYPGDGESPARAELLHPLRPPSLERLWGNRHASCALVAVGRVLYYFPYTGWGGVTHLVSYHLDTGDWRDHGPLVAEGGRRVAEVHSADAGADGRLYLVAFVYSKEGADTAVENAQRNGYPFHPRFMIIDPAADLHEPETLQP